MRDLTLSPADIPRKRDPVVTGIRLPCNHEWRARRIEFPSPTDWRSNRRRAS